jgi:hypothetical protein
MVLQRDPETALRGRDPGGRDLDLLRRGVVGDDVEARREHDERRHVVRPFEGRTQRHVGAEAVAEEMDGYFRMLSPDEVDEPADLVEPGAVLVDVAAPAG